MTACGLEFRSDRLWDSYIKWETDGKRLHKVTGIFDRLLITPTQGYTTHFDNFQEHVSANNPSKILDMDEFMALRKEVRALLKSEEKAADNADLPPGDEDSKLYTLVFNFCCLLVKKTFKNCPLTKKSLKIAKLQKRAEKSNLISL